MGSSLKKRCTQKVMAECTGKYRDSESRHMKYPVYEFDYEGKHYKVSKQQSAPGFTAEIGASYEIYINPDNPEEYYHPKADAAEKGFSMIFVIAFGGAFLFFAYAFLQDLFF
ncbi:MAG: hypothetical protein IJ379_06965 [Lachnospiraceae bacterium]|nr:hypothetical protein [Lachnospiraceae bacterium]